MPFSAPRELVARARQAADRLDHGPRRRRHRGADPGAAGAPGAGRHHRRRRQHELPRRRPAARDARRAPVRYVDAGVSGGVWGLQNGFCLMVGGEREAVAPLEPIFRTLAPEDGYLHTGGPGSGHYVKMIHNGIEYGLMQAYAEGFEILHASDYGLDLAAISDLWNHGSVVRSWLLELATLRVQVERPGSRAPQGLGRRLRRGPLDGPGGDRSRRPRADHHPLAADPVPLAPGRLVRRQGARRLEKRIRRSRVKSGRMAGPRHEHEGSRRAGPGADDPRGAARARRQAPAAEPPRRGQPAP